MLGPAAPVLTDGLPAPLIHVTQLAPVAARIGAHRATAVPDLPEGQFDVVVVCLQRNRAQSFGLLSDGLTRLADGGLLVIDGQKTDGVDAFLKRLKTAVPMDGVLSKSHGKIAWGPKPDPMPTLMSDWKAGAAPRQVDGLWTAPGMFSADGLDPGSALLIAHLPEGAKGRAADLGAGWGALSAALLAKAPKLVSLDLIEADHAALEAARRNVSDPRARFHWADATTFDGGDYDLIITNPPFHESRSADPALGRAFIQAAARLLGPKGRFLMVANRQLPYEKTLETSFRQWEQIETTPRYKIIRASHPLRQRKS
ncbi:class I SAM-dependent methyltransferase [Oceanibium sediminis]|uniref:class I SAM-dependent methyltransferase n=1 Tax=Oceanibium sediminis TaxID=2026339 RepID=UPI000DD40A88|nr:class I SAM-dependent methyltransferase [Oceanibium sediminis]